MIMTLLLEFSLSKDCQKTQVVVMNYSNLSYINSSSQETKTIISGFTSRLRHEKIIERMALLGFCRIVYLYGSHFHSDKMKLRKKKLL